MKKSHITILVVLVLLVLVIAIVLNYQQSNLENPASNEEIKQTTTEDDNFVQEKNSNIVTNVLED